MTNRSSEVQAVVFGIHSVRTLLLQRPRRIARLALQKDREDARTRELQRLAQQLGIAIEWRSAAELDGLAGSERHQGVLAQVHCTESLGEGALDALLDEAGTPALLLV